jgi:hypothetical protein
VIAASDRGHQHGPACAVAFGDPPQLVFAQLLLVREEAQIDGSVIQRAKRLDDTLPVIGANEANRDVAHDASWAGTAVPSATVIKRCDDRFIASR